MRQKILENILSKLNGLKINNQVFESLKNSFISVCEENKNESNEYRKDIEDKYKELLSKCNEFLNDPNIDSMKEAYPFIKAVIKPLECYVNNISNGKGLDDALSDNSWVKGYINNAPTFDAPKEYVPNEFNPSLDIETNINTYKDELIKAKENYEVYIKGVTGDTYMPKEVLKAEGLVLQGFIDSFGKDKFGCANVVTQMHEFYNLRLDPKNTRNLENGSVLSESFFDVSIGQNLDWTNTDAHLTEIKGLDDANKKLVISELKKLRFDGKKKEIISNKEVTTKFVTVGCTPDLLEKFEKLSYSIQVFYKAATLLTRDDDRVENSNHLANKVYKKLKGYSDRIIKSLKGVEGVTAPNSEEIKDVATEIENYLDNFPMEQLFTRDGIDIIAFDAYSFYMNDLCKLDPSLKNRAMEFKERFHSKIQLDKQEKLRNFLEGNYEFLTEDAKNRTFNNFKEYSLYGFSDLDSYYEDRFLRMARDPAYNLEMLNKLENTIKDFSKLNKSGYYTYFNNANIITADRNDERLPDLEVEGVAKKLYLAARKLKLEHEKIARYNDKNTTFKEKIGIAPDKEILNFVNSKNLDKYMMEGLREHYRDFMNNDLVKDTVDNMDIKDFYNKTTNETGFDNILNPSHESLIIGKLEGYMEVLTQNKRGIHSNSKEYSAIGKTLENINYKNSTILGATHKDYMKLYQACTNYVLSRDSNPIHDIGKERFNAAAKMVANLGDMIKDSFPESKEIFQNNDNINMVRSKVYRDERIELAQSKIQKIFNNNLNGITKESVEALSPEKKKVYDESLETIIKASLVEDGLSKLNSKAMITGKADTMDKMNEFLSKEKKLTKSLKKCISEFNKNPNEYALNLFGEGRKNVVNELKNKENQVDLINQL